MVYMFQANCLKIQGILQRTVVAGDKVKIIGASDLSNSPNAWSLKPSIYYMKCLEILGISQMPK